MTFEAGGGHFLPEVDGNDALLTFDPVNPETNPNPGGVNYCHLFRATQEDCDYTDYNWPTGLAKTNKNFMATCPAARRCARSSPAMRTGRRS